MIYVVNEVTDPYFNLALEEYVLDYLDVAKEYLLLWRNRPTVVVGKYQNTLEEINKEYIKEKKINVVRRNSGGGAVYHDLGNLNYTFIIKDKQVEKLDFSKYIAPIIKALQDWGIAAEFTSRNDITVAGKKISGNSQYIKENKVLHHGTLLFATNLGELELALKISPDKIISKGIKSIRSRVANIKEYLPEDVNIQDFRDMLLSYLFKGAENISQYKLSPQDLETINRLREEKYLCWQWNYGESPKFNIKKAHKYRHGKLETRIYVEDGVIKQCKFWGDFFGTGDLAEVESRLINRRYTEVEIKQALAPLNINKYFVNFTLDELLKCIT